MIEQRKAERIRGTIDSEKATQETESDHDQQQLSHTIGGERAP
jgi:hypothetical protein